MASLSSSLPEMTAKTRRTLPLLVSLKPSPLVPPPSMTLSLRSPILGSLSISSPLATPFSLPALRLMTLSPSFQVLAWPRESRLAWVSLRSASMDDADRIALPGLTSPASHSSSWARRESSPPRPSPIASSPSPSPTLFRASQTALLPPLHSTAFNPKCSEHSTVQYTMHDHCAWTLPLPLASSCELVLLHHFPLAPLTYGPSLYFLYFLSSSNNGVHPGCFGIMDAKCEYETTKRGAICCQLVAILGVVPHTR